jgi:DNA-binding beta-propeller fold protein YncE
VSWYQILNASHACEVKKIKHKKNYELKFTPTMRGKHQLHIKVDNTERSPYNITVRPLIGQLGIPVRTISDSRVINEPGGLTVNKKDEIVVVEGGRQCVSVFTPDGTNVRSFGEPELLGQKNLSEPHGLAVLDDGTILVTDSGNNCISVFTSEGRLIKSIGEHGSGERQFNQPMGIGIHPETLIKI